MVKLISFPIGREKLNKKNITIAAAVVLFLVAVGGYIWLQRIDRLPEFNLGAYLERLRAGVGTMTERGGQDDGESLPGKLTQEELQITLPSSARTYEQTAGPGEGITHLARRAAKEYLDRTGQGANLTTEHKVYIEDYIQNKTGEQWLGLGEKLSFSENLIKEAVEASLQLTNEQLENLKQYSAQISSL